MKKIFLAILILAAAAACDSPGTSGGGVDVPDKSDSSSDAAAADTSTPSDGSGADVAVPATCPSEAVSGLITLEGCDAAGQLCTLGTACGICQFVEGCAYYSDGPQWEYGQPVKNTGRAECPDERPDVGASCDVDFTSSGFAPCQYCKQNAPALVSCLGGIWVPTPNNYCQ